MRFSDQVFEELQMEPLSPTPSTSYRPQNPTLIYEKGGIISRKHAKFQSQSQPNLDQNLSRYALQKRLDGQHSSSSPSRQTAGSSEAESDGSVRFHSVSTVPSSPPLPTHSSSKSNQSNHHQKSYSDLLGHLNIPSTSTSHSNSRSFSRASFRSISSIGSKIRIKFLNFRQPSSDLIHKDLPPFTWAQLREEYELHLARGSIIERCLVDVCLEPDEPDLYRIWINRVWRLADKLSPALPAALLHTSADGLLPLLTPLRDALNSISDLIPFRSSSSELSKLEHLLARASRFAGLIERVIEVVSQVGLVKFELIGMVLEPDHYWTGEIKGKTGSGSNYKGHIRRLR
ncbi:hypothetical protein DFH28DRAFT_925255 [Melampsora americana]|nr:hypothetical protein DFH28DRAFT_925255 [Melampsora americana]